MTSEEALKVIGRFKVLKEINTVRNVTALICAMDALEKQIPKKPIFNKHSFEAYRCRCGACVGVYDLEHLRVIKSEYCPKCGQAIDWGEE